MILFNLLCLATMNHYYKTSPTRLMAISLLLLTGCINYNASHDSMSTVPVPQPVQSLAQTTVCCSSFSELHYQELPGHTKTTMSLDAEDPAFDFETGKSYVEPILIPQHGGVTLLQIESVVSRNSILENATVIYPAVTLLDSQYQHIVTLDDLPFTYNASFFGWNQLDIVLTIDDQYFDATYALIHTSSKNFSQSLSTRDPVRIVQEKDFDTLLYAHSSSSKSRIHFVETGVFKVLMYPL